MLVHMHLALMQKRELWNSMKAQLNQHKLGRADCSFRPKALATGLQSGCNLEAGAVDRETAGGDERETQSEDETTAAKLTPWPKPKSKN